MKPRNLTFTGFMGAGKSEVAECVAAALGLSLAEMDARIEKEQGCSIADIIKWYGEGHFRKLESELLRKLLDLQGVAISAGGGALVDGRNREMAREKSTVIWLKVDFDVAKYRVKNDKKPRKRPLFNDDARRRFEFRQSLYEEAAHIIVNANRPLDEVVKTVIHELSLLVAT